MCALVPQHALAQTREELQGVERPIPLQAPKLEIEGGVERSPCALGDPRFADVRVTIRKVNFNGLKGASPEELEPAWKPFEGTSQPVAVLCEIRDAAATILRNKGYLAANQVPTQRVDDGEVDLEVLFGRIAAVRARGDTRVVELKLQQYLGRLAESEIFDRDEAERYLLLARDLPGYVVNLTLQPAEGEVGALIGEVTVRRDRFALDFALQNFGASATGPVGGQVRGQLFGLTGLGDVTTLTYFTSSDFSEQHVVNATHEFRPNDEGLILRGQFTYAWTAPDLRTADGLGVPQADLQAETLLAGVAATYPVKRTLGENFYVSAGFDFVNQDVEFRAPLSRDRVRVGWLKLDYDAIDLQRRAPRYQVSGSLEYRQGLDILGASKVCVAVACPANTLNPGRLDGEPTSSVIRGSGTAEFALSSRMALALRPRAQLSLGGGLFGFEEFAAGNFSVGRGYAPGTIIGDSGVGLTTELRTSSLPIKGVSNFSIQPYVFFDLAKRPFRKGLSG
ncbi:MAG: ShlB/FhaC/HecB family hemolysin secretion/activation protein [Erythrobacter sp.]